MKSVDVLVAVRNEEKSIPLFIQEFSKHTPAEIRVNIIFLEDGSTDNTVKILREVSKEFNNVDYISLENKFGQYAALTLGLTISRADAVITMDVDGGHPIETAIEMIKSFLRGRNLVQGHRIIYKRKKFYRTAMSFLYNFFFYVIVGVNFFRQNVMFRLMDKSTKEKFITNKNWWHIFKTNFRARDKIETEYIEYEAPERELGESKYGFIRLLKLSYKSFFALLSLKRLTVLNLILTAIIILLVKMNFILLIVPISILLLVIDISYYYIINHYPLDKVKVIETSLSGINNE